MPKPCILQVIPALHSGGAEKTAVDVALAVRKMGWNAVVASAGGRLADQLEKHGINHVTLPLESKNPYVIWRNVARLQSVIHKYGVNIVHARSRAPAWAALFAARRAKIPFVTTYHGAYGQTNRIKALYNSVMARGDVVIANSQWTAELIAERHPDRKESIVAIARGTDFSQFEPSKVSAERMQRITDQWNIPKGKFIALHLARISPLKDQLNVVAAASILSNESDDIYYIFAGDHRGREAYLEKLKREISSAGLADTMIIPGYCDDPPAALAVADVVLSTSRSPETFGRVAVEASALETPVIVTKLGAVGETVLATPEVPSSKRTGWKIKHSNPPALADAILEVKGLTTAQLEQVGRNGRAYVLNQFSLQQMCDKTIRVYETLLN